MPNVYIINTNKTHNPKCEVDMIQQKKCAAYYKHFKYNIDLIQRGDLVFLYSNKNGIIARGMATGLVEVAEYEGFPGEEHYMPLDYFQSFEKNPMPASVILSTIQELAGDDYEIKWNQTTIVFPNELG